MNPSSDPATSGEIKVQVSKELEQIEIINQSIDNLIKNMSRAHLIHLNDYMLLIKLHRN